MPERPSVLIATGFRGLRPKVVENAAAVVAVGAVEGIYGLSSKASRKLVQELSTADLADRIVSHSKGLRKLEIGQLETLVQSTIASRTR